MKKKMMIIVALLFVITSFFCGCNRIISKDPPQAMSVIEYVDSTDSVFMYDLCIFPPVTTEETIQDYYFMRNQSLLDDTIVLYVRCKYDSDAFETEVDRISRINYGLFDADDSFMRDDFLPAGEIRYSEAEFNYPAYITVWRAGTCCSYALIDNDNQEIVYVYLQYARASDVKFSKSFLPQKSVKAFSLGNLLGYLP